MRLGNVVTMLGLAGFVAAAPLLDGEKQDAAALTKKLGDKDYKTRKEAFRALEKLGVAARDELEKAAKSDDPETRWSASLLLDRLDDTDAAPSGGLRERVDARDEPSARDGKDGDRTPGARRARGVRSTQDLMQEMHERLRRLEEQGGFGPGLFDDPFDDDFFRNVRTFRVPTFGEDDVQMGPGSSMTRSSDVDGKRESVTVKVDANGRATAEVDKDGEKTKYEADSFDALKKEHPELFQGGGLGGMGIRVQPFARNRVTTPREPREDEPQQQDGPLRPRREKTARPTLEKPRDLAREPRAPLDDVAAAANRPRLGVHVQPLSADVAEFLELEDGVGLEVVSVLADSAAAKLGVKRHDVIVKVNGRAIRSDQDVAKALEGKDPADAEVVVVRREAERTLGKKE